MSTLTLKLPAHLSAPRVREAARDLRLVTKQTAASSMAAHLAPPSGITEIHVTSRQVITATAEGVAVTAALLNWLRTNAAGIRINSDDNLLFHQDSVIEPRQLKGVRILRVVLPSIANIGVGEHEEARTNIERTAVRAANVLCATIVDLPDGVRRAVDEFIIEGLANVAEHAAVGIPDAQLTAFVTLREWDFADARAGGMEFDGFDVAEWLERHGTSETTKFIELTIADHGVGVATSLAEAYLRTRHDRAKLLSRREGWSTVHGEVLKWALSPFGSRKSPDDFANVELRRAWRGLYRVQFRTQALDGLAALRSGLGLFAAATVGHSHFTYTIPEGSTRGQRFAMPWTALTAVLPLTLRKRSAASNDEPLRIDQHEIIPPSTRPLPRSTTRQLESRLSTYSVTVRRSVLRAYDGLGARAHPAPIIGIVHPLVSLVPAVRYARPVGFHYFTHDRQSDAGRLLRILEDTALPGAIPVHLLLDVSPEAADEAQNYYAIAPEGSRAPSVCAVAATTDTTVHWFIHVENEPDAARLARFGELSTSDSPPAWWQELLTLYPTLFTYDSHDGDHRLLFSGNIELDVASLESALQAAIQTLATDRVTRSDWYWAAARGSAEYVRTSSGRVLRQFLSVAALCTEEPVAEQVLALCLVRRLEAIAAGLPLVVIPDTPDASFLVAKRLLPARSPLLALAHPDDVNDVHDAAPSEVALRAVVFADALYVGSRIERRMATLPPEIAVQAVVAVFNLHPEASEPLSYSRTEAIIDWPFPSPDEMPLTTVEVFEVDTITNELLSRRVIAEMERYKSLLWQPPISAGTESTLLQPDRFDYGYQWFGERLHVVRCPTKRLLDDDDAFAVLATWLSNVVQHYAVAGTNVVIVTRDDAPFSADVGRLLVAVMQRLGTARWPHHLMHVTIETTRRHGRQILRHQLNAVLRGASIIHDGQLPLLSQDEQQPNGAITVVYLDNATVTGRALRDIALALTELSDPPVAEFLVCAIVNKLSPADEQLFRQIATLHASPDGAGLPLKLFSVYQLRLPTYERFESTDISRLMTRLIMLGDGFDQQEVVVWTRELTMLQHSVEASERPLLYPLGPADAPNSPISIDAIYFRHLIAVYQDGFPVVDAVVATLHRLLRARDASLIDVLALEPGLLDEPLLAGPFAVELGELAMSVVRGDTDGFGHTGRRRNALLVISQLPEVFVNEARELAQIALTSPDLRPVFLGLCFALPSATVRDRVLRRVVEIDGEQLQYMADAELQRAVLLVRAALWTNDLPRPATSEERWSAVEQLLRTARGHHKYGGYAAWWDAQLLFAAGASPRVSLKEELSRVQWQEIENFASSVLAPAVHALWHLAKRLPRGILSADALLRRVYAQLVEVQRQAERVIDGSADERPLQQAWLGLQHLTLSTSVNVLYPQNRDTVLATGGADAAIGDELLTGVVQEPIGLLLHSFGRYFGNDLTVRLTIRGTVDHAAYDSITAHVRWLSAMWMGPCRMPLLVRGADDLRLCYQVFSHNVQCHGAADPDVTIDISATEAELSVRLLNVVDERKRQRVHGRGSGLQQAEHATRRLRGYLDARRVSLLYRVEHTVPIRWLTLPPRGES